MRDRGRSLFGYAFVLTGDRDRAEDLLQDALVRAFKSGRYVRSVDAAHVYVKKAIATAFVDGGRRAAARPRYTEAGAEDLLNSRTREVGVDSESIMDLRAAVLLLPPRERACVVLRYMEDMRVDEVADAIGVAPGTVKRYLHDAIVRLRASLPDLDFDDADFAEVQTAQGGTQ